MILIINSEQIKLRAIQIIQNINISTQMEVTIKKHKIDRSASQNSLYWAWLTIIANYIGITKNEAHERYKGMFLVPIYERDDKEYATMINSLRDVYVHDKKTALYLRKQIVKLTSTRTATAKQFTEYLADIEHDAISIGINLPHPEDEYYLAMGTK